MQDWNVVVSVHAEGYRAARRLLAPFGAVGETDFFNVLVLRVDDVEAFIARLAALVDAQPGVMNDLSRVAPLQVVFDFADRAAFEARAKQVALAWRDRLAGKSFHVRMHRRGLKREISSQDEERFLDTALLEALDAAGTPGRIDFADPDAIIDVETVGLRGGLALWTRDELRRYLFLRLD